MSGFLDWFRKRPDPKPQQLARKEREYTERELVEMKATEGYRPRTPLRIIYGYANQIPPLFIFYQDVETLILHPRSIIAGDYYKSGLADAEFEVKARDSAIGRYVQEYYDRLWTTSLSTVQEGYIYGWLGCEAVYRWNDDGMLAQDYLKSFHPRDIRYLTRDDKFYGIRVTRVEGAKGSIDLHGACGVPSKAFWYAHKAKHGAIYGLSQYLGAWRPWRRLACQDGGEDIADLAMYRYGVRGPIGYYPPGTPNFDEQKRDSRNPTNADVMDFIVNAYKSGAGVSFPSTVWEGTEKPKWGLELPNMTMDLKPLDEHNGHLEDQMAEGIGTPKELWEASESGSGYSGREIPLEGFFTGQRCVGRDIIRQSKPNLDALLVWNFGEGADQGYEVDIKPLLETRAKRKAGMNGAAGPTGTMVPEHLQGPQDNGQQPAVTTDVFGRANDPPEMYRFSTHESVQPLAQPEVEAAVVAVLAALRPLRSKLSQKIVAAIRMGNPADPERWNTVKQLLSEFRNESAQLLAQARVASALSAMRRVVGSLPRASVPNPSTAGQSAPPVAPPAMPTALSANGEPIVRLPLIEEAAKDLMDRRILTKAAFNELANDARQQAFTVAAVSEQSTLETIRDSLANVVATGQSKRDWEKELEEKLDGDPFLSNRHRETVFRANVHSAYSNGQEQVLKHPLVGDHFPYRAIDEIRDNRVRDWHLALNTNGLDGTNIYRADDPIWQVIRPPSAWGCRGGWGPISIEQAAAAGVKEAIRWLETGNPPTRPEHRPLPPNWQQSPGWVR